MSKSPLKFDRRLLGKWRSDRRRSFRFYCPGPKSTAAGQRRFRSLFGKMTIRWTQRRYHIELNGAQWSEPYEIVASDDNSVVVRTPGPDGKPTLSQIHFEGDYYWVAAWGVLCEYFRRID